MLSPDEVVQKPSDKIDPELELLRAHVVED